MSDYSDRRKEARSLVGEFMLVYDKTGTLLGYLRDLTANGAQVNGNKPMKKGIKVDISIELKTQ